MGVRHKLIAHVKKISCVSRFSPAPTVSPVLKVGPYSDPVFARKLLPGCEYFLPSSPW